MGEVWFDPARYSWIPGSVLGALGGGVGAPLAMALAAKGRRLGLHVFVALLLISVGLLLAGVVAYLDGQPWGVWYGLGLAGAIGTLLFAGLLPKIRKVLREAEERRLAARDL